MRLFSLQERIVLLVGELFQPALSHRNAEFVSQQQAREMGHRARQVDSMDFFNLITGPELLEPLEALWPEYGPIYSRRRAHYPEST